MSPPTVIGGRPTISGECEDEHTNAGAHHLDAELADAELADAELAPDQQISRIVPISVLLTYYTA
jgi:hypothetical protein